jgi:hypothetical protein
MQKRKRRKLAGPKDCMVKAYLEPRFEQISQRAREMVIEILCRPRCGQVPSEEFCFIGRIVYKEVLQGLMYREGGLN